MASLEWTEDASKLGSKAGSELDPKQVVPVKASGDASSEKGGAFADSSGSTSRIPAGGAIGLDGEAAASLEDLASQLKGFVISKGVEVGVVLEAEVAVDPGGHGGISTFGLLKALLFISGSGTKFIEDVLSADWKVSKKKKKKKKKKVLVDMHGTNLVSDGVGAGFPGPIMG